MTPGILEIGAITIVLLLILIALLLSRDGINGYNKVVIGTVIAINGTTITLKSKVRFNGEVTAYTVDASNATITKNTHTASGLGIAVGDTVIIRGTITGIIFAAKVINDKTPHVKVSPPKETEIM